MASTTPLRFTGLYRLSVTGWPCRRNRGSVGVVFPFRHSVSPASLEAFRARFIQWLLPHVLARMVGQQAKLTFKIIIGLSWQLPWSGRGIQRRQRSCIQRCIQRCAVVDSNEAADKAFNAGIDVASDEGARR